MRVHAEPRYLIPESLELIGRVVKTHPFLGSLMLLVLFGMVLSVLRWIFGRTISDLLIFALVISAILLVFGSSLYTYTHVKGFHFGG